MELSKLAGGGGEIYFEEEDQDNKQQILGDEKSATPTKKSLG